MAEIDLGSAGTDRDRAIEALLGGLADAIDPDRLSDEILEAIYTRVEEFAEDGDEDLRRMTGTVATRTLHDVWRGLRRSSRTAELDPPPVAAAWPAELVHRGIELHAMLRAYRLGHELVEAAWQTTISRLEADDDVRAEALLRASRFFFAYVDAVSVQLTHTYIEERARRDRGAAVLRAETVRELLDGGSMPADRASAALRYDVSGTHVGFIVWMEPSEPDGRHAVTLESVAARVGSVVGRGGEVMLVPVGNWVVWGWARVIAHDLDRVRAELVVPDPVHVTVGDASPGIDGLIRTHDEATAARRVARFAGNRSERVVFHHDVALLELLTADPVAAQRFVRAELGPLAVDDEQAARLRSTVQVYLDENLSPIRTARRLGVNKNTVVNRMEKVEDLLGHAVLSRRREIEAALRLAAADPVADD